MKSILSLLLVCSFTLMNAQQYWKSIEESTITNHHQYERGITPQAYKTYELDTKLVEKMLAKAPMEDLSNTLQQGIKMNLPMPDGSLQEFDFVESPCMSPVLSAKYPHIKSYRGYSEDGSRSRIAFSNHGFNGSITGPKGDIYVDSYYEEADGNYISYYTVDDVVDTDDLPRSCGVLDYEENQVNAAALKNGEYQPRVSKKRGTPVIKTTYRFALACTGKWGTQQGGGNKDLVLTKMNIGVNRLNQILEDELAIKLELIDNNDDLIFFNDSNNPYSEPNENIGFTALGENQRVLNNTVGEGNFDIGHVFTIRCDDVGGVAALASVCGPTKGRGVSCVGTRNLSNFMASTTAHEIGHQFAAGHTFGACNGTGQHSGVSSVEPGSGVTILSYSGLCGSNNTGPEVALYHSFTLQQMSGFALEGNGARCGTKETTDNNHPDVSIVEEGGSVIPIGTPFELNGIGTDADGDELLFSWEQIDISGLPADIGDPSGPLFRYLIPSTETKRVFPAMNFVLQGRDWREERMPILSRDLTFRFVARDDNPTAGGVNWTDIAFESSDSAGPFVVNQPNRDTIVEPGQTYLVEWEVANTDNDIVNCKAVDIYLSDDGGQTFPHLLLEKTPNVGSAVINVPNVVTTQGIIKVKGNNNVFFNVGMGKMTINEATTPRYFATLANQALDVCLPASVQTEINSEAILGYDEMVNLDIVSGLPSGATYSFSQNPIPANGSAQLNIDLNEVMVAGLYSIVIQATGEGVDTSLITLSLDAGRAFLDDFKIMSPADGSSGFTKIPQFEWNPADDASGYRLEVATNPSFSPETIILIDEAGNDTITSGQANLDNNTLYYWKVVAYNDCIGEYESEINTFSSISLSCADYSAQDVPVNIPSSGTPTITSTINIEAAGAATDINVNLIKGNHTKLNSIRGTLISPDGTEVVLWQGGCNNTPILNAGFDDDSPFANGCPSINGQKMLPREPLSTFIGKTIDGSWMLQLEDTQPANGGTLSEFSMEICSDSALDNPYLVNNNVLEVKTGSSNFITRDLLLSEDDNNGAEDLLYTLVRLPQLGSLSLEGESLIVGAQFTQEQLTTSNIRYSHATNVDSEDNFVFTVIDGEGGWIGQTLFVINASEDGFSATNDITSADSFFEVYPNPSNDLIYIDKILTDNSDWSYSLLSLDGKEITRSSFRNKAVVDVTNRPSGVYFIRLSNGETVMNKKILVVE